MVSVDGQYVDCSPDGLRAALGSARPPAKPGTPGHPGWVLLIDGYERLASRQLDSTQLVASLPEEVLVVIAGRDAPATGWRTDLGWRAVVDCLPIGALNKTESEQLLAHAGVSENRRRGLARIGRGHPLTLAMLADAAASGDVPEDSQPLPTW